MAFYLGENALTKLLTLIKEKLDQKVPVLRTINGKDLSKDITLTAADIGALPNTTVIPSIDGLATEDYVDNIIVAISQDQIDIICENTKDNGNTY